MTPARSLLAMESNAHMALISKLEEGMHPAQSIRQLAECAPLLGGCQNLLEERVQLYDVTAAGIALIPVMGTLVDYLDWCGSRWVTGYNVLRLQLEAAFEDDDVKGIALLVDSGGGLVSGLFDFIDWALEAKKASGKPVAAICMEEAYSAAYAIAAIADTISVPRTGGVGSIGVLAIHIDMTGWLEKIGDKWTLIRAGARKAEGHFAEPLSDTARASIQESVDEIRTMFVERIAASRGIDADVVMGTEARTFFGPKAVKQAVQLGLADAVLPPAVALERFADHLVEASA